MRIRLSILPSEAGQEVSLLHEAVIDKVSLCWEIAMDSDYILCAYNRHDSRNSEIEIRNTSTFEVSNTIVLGDGTARMPPYAFHYLNGLMITSLKSHSNWIRLTFRL